jgi:DNA-directed RNA polymerase sigma subunit (sigma70/sigma32)
MGLNDIGRDEMFKALISIRLTKKEKDIISCRYGLEDGKPRSFDEVAKILNVNPDYVRIVERKALVELRNNSNATRIRNAIIVNKYNEKQEKRAKNIRSKRNIYEYFCDYTEEEIDEAINELSEDEKSILADRYGSDLKNPTLNELSKKQMQCINNQILPKIQMVLDGSYSETDDSEEWQFNERQYVESMKDLKRMGVESVIKGFPHEESIVLSLAFGMVEEKFFTPHEISEMLNIPEENVKETISNGLTKYESMTSSKVKEASTELNKGRQKIKKKNP